MSKVNKHIRKEKHLCPECNRVVKGEYLGITKNPLAYPRWKCPKCGATYMATKPRKKEKK